MRPECVVDRTITLPERQGYGSKPRRLFGVAADPALAIRINVVQSRCNRFVERSRYAESLSHQCEYPLRNIGRDASVCRKSEKRPVALRLPSAVIPSEFIYLLNPAHLDFSRAVQLGKEVDVFLDPRLWR
jgi:hypothetical protein